MKSKIRARGRKDESEQRILSQPGRREMKLRRKIIPKGKEIRDVFNSFAFSSHKQTREKEKLEESK